MQRYNEPPPSTPPASPRRGDLRQPTINSFTPFRRSDDDDQLTSLFRTIRDLIREDIEFEDAEAEVNNLQGHQDIQDMFARLDNMDFIPSLRLMADILELIDNKLEALEALDGLEQVNAALGTASDSGGEGETDVDTTDSESDDDLAPPPVRRQLIFTSDSDSDDDIDAVDVSASLRF